QGAPVAFADLSPKLGERRRARDLILLRHKFISIVIPGRAKREPGIHNHRCLRGTQSALPRSRATIPAARLALGSFAQNKEAKRAAFVFRECGKPQARCGYGFRAHSRSANAPE